MAGTGKSQAEGAQLLKLALSMHRNPASAAASVSGTELPESMEILLRVANGDPELLAWAKGVTGTGEKELKCSCIAFIERVFFADDADPFRVLGLNPWAMAENIKEHYRLLIRLFHPDRGVAEHASAEIYAAMINQAHSRLKKLIPANPARDEARRSASHAAVHAERGTPLSVRVPLSVHSAADKFSLRCSLARLTPAKVLAGVAAIAALMVAAPFLQENLTTTLRSGPMTTGRIPVSRDAVEPHQSWDYGNVLAEKNAPPPAPQLPAQDPAPPSTGEPGAAEPPRSKEPSGNDVLPPKRLPDTRRVQSLPLTEKVSLRIGDTSAVADTEVQVAPVVRAQVKAGADIQDAKETLKSDSVIASGLQPRAQRGGKQSSLCINSAACGSPRPFRARDDELNQPIPNDIPAQGLVPPTVPTTHNAPSEMELHNVIAQFIGSYARGDLGSFMSMFDDKVRTDEPGGKAGIRDTYTRFFSNTLARDMVIKDLRWQRSGDLAIGLANYHVSISRPGSAPRSNSGTLQIEVARTGTEVAIVGFFHRAVSK